MISRQDRTALALILIGISVALPLPQVLAKASGPISPQDGPSAESRVVLEITRICNGWCGVERASRLLLLEDATAVYVTYKSGSFDLANDDIILKKSTHLADEEYEQFINLAESRQFMKSAPLYDSKIYLDALAITTVTYKKSLTTKQIILWNYSTSAERSANDPPDEVRRLIERANELSHKIRESGT